MPRALFQRPENGNCAKRIPKSGRARSPPAYIKPQEPSRPPVACLPRGEGWAGAPPGCPGLAPPPTPAQGPGVTQGGGRGLGLSPSCAPETLNWLLITLAGAPIRTAGWGGRRKPPPCHPGIKVLSCPGPGRGQRSPAIAGLWWPAPGPPRQRLSRVLPGPPHVPSWPLVSGWRAGQQPSSPALGGGLAPGVAGQPVRTRRAPGGAGGSPRAPDAPPAPPTPSARPGPW